MHRHTRPDAGHAAPVCTRYQTDRDGQIVTAAGCWRAWSASETVQIWTQEQRTKTGYIFITFSCMFVAHATLQIH